MTVVSRAFGRRWLLGLTAISLAIFTDSAYGQAPTKKTSGKSAHSLDAPVGVTGRMTGYVPKHAKVTGVSTTDFGTDIVNGGTYYEDSSTGDLIIEESSMVGSCCTDGGCGDCSLVPCCTISPGNLEVFVGVEGFTGPSNRGGSASFGFNEGVNWAIPISGFNCLGGQLGFRATHSSLSGAEFTNDTRNQVFVTGGLFRRVDVGLQGGLVVDYLSDAWYRNGDFMNLRGELSWVTCGTRDFGVWFTNEMKTSQEPSPNNQQIETWGSTDLYALFFREQFGACNGSEARIFAGFSGESDGLLGADVRLPLTSNWALETGFAYLVPKQGEGTVAGSGINLVGHAQESWNLGINMVWYPGKCRDQYNQPLFPVADNGCFMLDLQ